MKIRFTLKEEDEGILAGGIILGGFYRESVLKPWRAHPLEAEKKARQPHKTPPEEAGATYAQDYRLSSLESVFWYNSFTACGTILSPMITVDKSSYR